MSSSSSSSDDSGHEPRVRRRRVINHITIVRLLEDYASDEETHTRRFGINKEQFDTLHNLLIDDININTRAFSILRPIRGRDQLGLCLRFLASGRQLGELSAMYEIREPVMEAIVREVCIIIMRQLVPLTMPNPNAQRWSAIADEYEEIFKVPNVLGSVYGMRLNVENQTDYIFLALVDAKCNFISIEVAQFNVPAQHIWDNSEMCRKFEEEEFFVPFERAPYGGHYLPLPFVLVGGYTFPSKPYMLTFFSHKEMEENDAYKVFNCRIFNVKENNSQAFRRLRHRWCIIRSRIPASTASVESIVTAACCLENYFPTPFI